MHSRRQNRKSTDNSPIKRSSKSRFLINTNNCLYSIESTNLLACDRLCRQQSLEKYQLQLIFGVLPRVTEGFVGKYFLDFCRGKNVHRRHCPTSEGARPSHISKTIQYSLGYGKILPTPDRLSKIYTVCRCCALFIYLPTTLLSTQSDQKRSTSSLSVKHWLKS